MYSVVSFSFKKRIEVRLVSRLMKASSKRARRANGAAPESFTHLVETVFFAKSGIGKRRPRGCPRGGRGQLEGVETTRERPVDVTAYLVPVDALQRGLDLRLREGGWVAKSERAALRARRGCPERVFECADRRSGTQRARGHVEGVAEDAARA